MRGTAFCLVWQSKANNLIKTTHWKALIFMKWYIYNILNQPLNPNDDSHGYCCTCKNIIILIKNQTKIQANSWLSGLGREKLRCRFLLTSFSQSLFFFIRGSFWWTLQTLRAHPTVRSVVLNSLNDRRKYPVWLEKSWYRCFFSSKD